MVIRFNVKSRFLLRGKKHRVLWDTCGLFIDHMFLSLHQNTPRLASLSLLSTTRCLSSSPRRLRRFFLISHASIGVSLGGLFVSLARLDGSASL